MNDGMNTYPHASTPAEALARAPAKLCISIRRYRHGAWGMVHSRAVYTCDDTGRESPLAQTNQLGPGVWECASDGMKNLQLKEQKHSVVSRAVVSRAVVSSRCNSSSVTGVGLLSYHWQHLQGGQFNAA